MIAVAMLLAGAVAASAPAQVFAPGTISSEQSDFAPAFARDGSWIMFSRGANGITSLYVSRRERKSWSASVVAPFSGRWIDLESSLAPDNLYVVFASDRPIANGDVALTAQYYGKTQTGGNLWRVDRTKTGWGEPYRLSSAINVGNSVWTPSIARNGEIYFMATDAQTGRFRIHAAAQQQSAATRDLAFSTGATNDVDPYIAPDQRFLIFSSDRGAPGKKGLPGPERLFIAFDPAGVHPLVCRMNIPGFEDTSLSEVEARLSPDRTTLYFASRRAAHEKGAPPAGAWDNGKSNIWSIRFTPSLWRDATGCAAKTL